MSSYRWFKQQRRLLYLALVLVSINLPVLAYSNLNSANSGLPNRDPSIVAIDILDAVEGAVQYIQVSNISDEQEVEIGKQTNQQILQQYQLHNSPQVQQYMRNLGNELLNNSDNRDIPFTFQVVESDEVNAFATPGGFVYVTTGLLRTAENRAQLASVVAHEIAHINERHGVKGLKQAVAAQGIANTVGVDSDALAQMAYRLTVDLPRSRSFEYEADRSGLQMLQQAGYPPQAFANFLAKLEGGGGTPEFIRTHPTSENRIEAISQTETASQVSTNKGQDKSEYQNNVIAYL